MRIKLLAHAKSCGRFRSPSLKIGLQMYAFLSLKIKWINNFFRMIFVFGKAFNQESGHV